MVKCDQNATPTARMCLVLFPQSLFSCECLTSPALQTHTQAEENRRNRKKLTSIFLRLRFIIYGERLNWKSEIYVEKWFNKKNIPNPALGITPLEVICLIGAVI